MACCDQKIDRGNLLANYYEMMRNMPLESMCCLTRLVYAVTRNAYVWLRKDVDMPTWDQMDEHQRRDLAIRVQDFAGALDTPNNEFERLLIENIKSMAVQL